MSQLCLKFGYLISQFGSEESHKMYSYKERKKLLATIMDETLQVHINLTLIHSALQLNQIHFSILHGTAKYTTRRLIYQKPQ